MLADGFVIMQCLEPVTGRQSGQLLLDYLTDTVISTKPTLPGIPFISPDSRKLVTLDRTENGATLIVQEITCEFTQRQRQRVSLGSSLLDALIARFICQVLQ